MPVQWNTISQKQFESLPEPQPPRQIDPEVSLETVATAAVTPWAYLRKASTQGSAPVRTAS